MKDELVDHYYKVAYFCENCRRFSWVWWPKGVEAPQFTPCPNCELPKAEKCLVSDQVIKE